MFDQLDFRHEWFTHRELQNELLRSSNETAANAILHYYEKKIMSLNFLWYISINVCSTNSIFRHIEWNQEKEGKENKQLEVRVGIFIAPSTNVTSFFLFIYLFIIPRLLVG